MAGNKVAFRVVVNGESVDVEANVHEPLRNLVRDALKETENEAGHALEDWEIRDVKGGTPLDQSKKIEDFHFPGDVKLYVDLKVGGGG